MLLQKWLEKGKEHSKGKNNHKSRICNRTSAKVFPGIATGNAAKAKKTAISRVGIRLQTTITKKKKKQDWKFL